MHTEEDAVSAFALAILYLHSKEAHAHPSEKGRGIVSHYCFSSAEQDADDAIRSASNAITELIVMMIYICFMRTQC